MIRITSLAGTVLLLLSALSFSAPPLVVVLYSTAVWGPHCPKTENACSAILNELGEERFCPLALHIGDEFYTSAVDGWVEHYQVEYIPAPVLDGSYDVNRGIDYDALLPLVEERLLEERPIALEIDGEIAEESDSVNVTVSITPEAESFFSEEGSEQLTLVVFLREDDLYFTGVTHQFICRDLFMEEVTIGSHNQTTTVEHSFPLAKDWSKSNLSVGAYIQDSTQPLQEYSVYNGAFDDDF